MFVRLFCLFQCSRNHQCKFYLYIHKKSLVHTIFARVISKTFQRKLYKRKLSQNNTWNTFQSVCYCLSCRQAGRHRWICAEWRSFVDFAPSCAGLSLLWTVSPGVKRRLSICWKHAWRILLSFALGMAENLKHIYIFFFWEGGPICPLV